MFVLCVLPYRNPNIWPQDLHYKVSGFKDPLLVQASMSSPPLLLTISYSMPLKHYGKMTKLCCNIFYLLFMEGDRETWRTACLKTNFIQTYCMTVETWTVIFCVLSFRVEWPNQQSFYKVSIIHIVSTWISRPGFWGLVFVKGRVPQFWAYSLCFSCSFILWISIWFGQGL